MTGSSVLMFPEQVVSDRLKNKDWAKSCVDAGESIITIDSAVIRQSFYNKRVNYRLYNGQLTDKDVERVIEPYGEQFKTFPKNVQHQELANAKVRILVGEEAKKLTRFPYRVHISSSDEMGISSKEEQMKAMWMEKMVQMVEQNIQDPELVQQELLKQQKYLKYSWQDLKEITMNKILRYEYNRLGVSELFLRSWEDFLITGEEIMCIEELGNDLSVRKVNPLYVFAIQSQEAYKIQDSEMIVEFTMMPLGEVLNQFYDDLTPADVVALEKYRGMSSNVGPMGMGYTRDITLGEWYGNTDIIQPNETALSYFSSTFDIRGNIRVVRTQWRSKRKLQEITFFDDYGIEDVRIEDEFYKADKSLGETSKVIIINEWWEGTKIGNDIYCKLRPLPYQDRKLTNLAQASPSYVGIYCNTNNSKVRSFLDITKATSYLYDIYHHRLNLISAKYKGPMTLFNVSMVPEAWDPKKWFGVGEATGWLPMDPTNEILKGPSQGKSAGNFNTLTAQTIDQQMGQYISQQIQMLQFLRQEMDVISGVNDARQGDMDGDQRVGTAQMAWTASNSATEKYISLHNEFKKDVLSRMLSVAKYVWKNNPKKAQYVLDDGGIELVQWFDDISESEYDLETTDNANVAEMMQAIKQLAHAAMQNGVMRFKDIIAVYQKDSVSALARYLEQAEEEAMQQQAESAKAERQHEMQVAAQAAEVEQQYIQLEYDKMENENINKELDRANKIEVETLKALGFAENTDINANAVPDVIEQGKLALETNKQYTDILLKEKELAFNADAKNKELKIKEQELKLKERLEQLKIKQTEIQNKSQERIANQAAKLKEKEIAVKKIAARRKPSK
jgi:hypothetical protein